MENTLRMRVSKESHKIYKNLTDKKGLFDQMSDMFFWCVLLGYSRGMERKKLGKQLKGVFQWGVFSQDIQKPILQMVAVEVKDDFAILNSSNQKIQDEFRDIIEELAEAGLSQLLMAFDENTIDHEKLFKILLDILP
jgi:dnd system-associated protein 4|tara:strand:- start:18 stop:428 length:411 start_codon:yes stop_codon:yes gene_type:complete